MAKKFWIAVVVFTKPFSVKGMSGRGIGVQTDLRET
jgi:hypothetical protein